MYFIFGLTTIPRDPLIKSNIVKKSQFRQVYVLRHASALSGEHKAHSRYFTVFCLPV